MDKEIFIKASIDDIQATIRAIDAKITVLMGFLIFPLANIGKIIDHLQILAVRGTCISILVVAVFALAWVFALWVSFRAIAAIDNPEDHITQTESCNGSFYSGGLFKMGFFDSLLNCSSTQASQSFEEYTIALEETVICKELCLEKMKVVYIRDMKLNRLKWGLKGTFVWLVAGILVYFLSRFG